MARFHKSLSYNDKHRLLRCVKLSRCYLAAVGSLCNDRSTSATSQKFERKHATIYEDVPACSDCLLYRYRRICRVVDVEWRRNRSWSPECSPVRAGLGLTRRIGHWRIERNIDRSVEARQEAPRTRHASLDRE